MDSRRRQTDIPCRPSLIALPPLLVTSTLLTAAVPAPSPVQVASKVLVETTCPLIVT
jgi:hypothetical protein